MKNFILKRLLQGIIVLFGVIIISFVVTRVVPSNPALQWVGSRATAEQIAAAEEELGLNKPISVQLGIYLKDLMHGDLGYSLKSHRPVTDEILENAPATIELVFLGTILAIVLGLTLGVVTASHKNHWQDHLGRFFSVGTVSLPTFWVAMLFQLIFYSMLKMLPISDCFMGVYCFCGTCSVEYSGDESKKLSESTFLLLNEVGNEYLKICAEKSQVRLYIISIRNKAKARRRNE